MNTSRLLQRGITVAAASAFSLFSLNACSMDSHPVTPNGAVPSDVRVYGTGEGDPNTAYAHRNPHPQHLYELHVTIESAPGTFKHAEASVSVQAQNPPCGLPRGFPVDSIYIPTATAGLEVQQISDTEFKTIFAADPLINESYWKGQPVCEWGFVGTTIAFQATGAEGETWFEFSIDPKDLKDGQTMKRFYWKGRYPRSGVHNFPDSGGGSIEEFKPDLRNALFTITASVRKVQP